MVVLAMNERGEAVARVALDALPHVEHRAARRVDENAPDRPQVLEVLDRDAEGWQDDDIFRVYRREIEARAITTIEDIDPHLAQLCVHVRIVNDLADEKDSSIGELAPRLIRVFHCALHAVAEAELARKPDGDVADGQRVVAIAQKIDQPSLVGGELRLNLRLEAETLAKVCG